MGLLIPEAKQPAERKSCWSKLQCLCRKRRCVSQSRKSEVLWGPSLLWDASLLWDPSLLEQGWDPELLTLGLPHSVTAARTQPHVTPVPSRRDSL